MATIRDWSNFIAGRTALITGAGGGVGRAIAIQMARAGAHLWVNDLHLDRAEKVCAEIEAERLTAWPVVADVTDRDAVIAMDDEIAGGEVEEGVHGAGRAEAGAVFAGVAAEAAALLEAVEEFVVGDYGE